MGSTSASRRQPRGLIVASFALLLAVHCNVYDASLLGSGVARGGDSTMAGSFGTSGSSGTAEADAGEGAIAGEPSGGAGSAGRAETAGSTDVGGAVERGGSAGNGSGGGGKGGAMSTGGATGAGAGGAGTGSAGTAGASAGSGGGAVQTSKGCAKLSVPLVASGDKAHFVISLASPADLSAAKVSMRLYVQAGTGGTLFNYVQDNGTYHFLGVPPADRRELSSFSGWSTLTWNVGTEPEGSSGIVKTSIKNIGIELNAQPSSAWTSPTIVYVDSVTVTTPTLSFTFDASTSVYTTPTTMSAASQALWLNSGASDTTATGAALGWQSSCP